MEEATDPPAALPSSEAGDPLAEASALLDELRQYHETYFCQQLSEKEALLQGLCQRIDDTLLPLTSLRDEDQDPSQRSLMCLIRGRALETAHSAYHPEAEALLSRAAKLRPEDPTAWAALAHCLWKKRDLVEAAKAYGESIRIRPSPEALQELSLLVRKMGGGSLEAAQRSVQLAKDAVNLDLSDHKSWYFLGNAQTARFFAAAAAGGDDLSRALRAYDLSEARGGGVNPDLFFNRAKVHQYLQQYPQALRDLRLAHDIDPGLEAAAAAERLEAWLRRVGEAVERKGRVKAKKVQQLMSDIAQAAGDEEPLTVEGVLAAPPPPEARLHVAPVLSLSIGDTPPECYLCLDATGAAAVVAVYHLKPTSLRKVATARVLSIAAPRVVVGEAENGGGVRFVQVMDHSSLLVDGKRLAAEARAAAHLTTATFDT